MELGHDRIGAPRHRHRVAPAEVIGVEDGAGPVIGTDPRELGYGREHRRQPRRRFDGPDLGIVAIARDEDDSGGAGALAFEVDSPSARVDAAVEVSGRGGLRGGCNVSENGQADGKRDEACVGQGSGSEAS